MCGAHLKLEKDLPLYAGRGIYAAKTLMDAVDFEQRGVVVRMRKRPNADPGAMRNSQ
jgi:hypothetical protein